MANKPPSKYFTDAPNPQGEVGQMHQEAAKMRIRVDLPLIIECLLEDDDLLMQLAEALKSVEPTQKVKTRK